MNTEHWASYAGKRVIVTGCHSGIGHATAQRLCESGAIVHGLDWKPCDLALTAFSHVDLRDSASIDAALSACSVPIDTLFNCAGIPPGAAPVDVVKVNFLGTRQLTEGLLPFMHSGSAIVNVASVAGLGWQGHIEALRQFIRTDGFEAGVAWCEIHSEILAEGYSFSKQAVVLWTMTEAARLIRRGIRMNCTLPGAVQTPMLEEIEKVTPTEVIDQITHPIGRRSSADEQANTLLFLNSDLAGYINGAALSVDGGYAASVIVK